MLDEWRFPNRATPEGSAAYYSLRFAPKDLRDDLAVLLAWRHEVHAVLEDVSDPGVARLKLHWWRNELDLAFTGKPSHPLIKALQPVLAQHALPQALFTSIAERMESEVLRRQPADEADLDAACDRDMGALFELIVRCHGLTDPVSLATARRLGIFCARVYLIRDSGALARKGRTVLSVERLQRHGLSAEALTRHEHRIRLSDLLAPSAAETRSKLVTSHLNRRMPACIRARTRILETLLHEIEIAGFDVADQRIGLTPLRKLWLAWRESRRN